MSKRKKKTAMQKRRERYFGIVKIPARTKLAWLAKQDKNGWALGLALENRTVWLRGLRFSTKKEIDRVVNRTTIVHIQLKDNKEE